MAKYMVLYNSTATASETMANATPEEMKASVNEWIRWQNEAAKTAKVEFGLPLRTVSHISSSEVAKSDSQISGYATIEGDSKEDIIKLLQTHPHLKRPGASIDLLEMLSMPEL